MVTIFFFSHFQVYSARGSAESSDCVGVLGTILNATAMFTTALDQFQGDERIAVSGQDVTLDLDDRTDSATFLVWGAPASGGQIYAQSGFESNSCTKEQVRSSRPFENRVY